MSDLRSAGAPEELPAADGGDSVEMGRRARRGVGSLFVRQAIGQGVTLAGGVALARLLEPADFAVYAICAFFQESLGQVSQAGLAAALVQQRSEPTERELRAAFGLQTLLVALIAVAGVVAGPWVAGLHPELSRDHAAVLAAMVLGMAVGSTRSLPMAILQRGLRFDAIGRLEIAEVVVFQGAAVALAIAGWGVWALGAAMVAKSCVGVIIAYCLSGWVPRVAWDPDVARRLLRFGVPFQLRGLVGKVSSGLPALIVAPVVGAGEFGLMLWGANVGSKAFFLSRPLVRVAYPHFCVAETRGSLPGTFQNYLTVGLFVIASWLIFVEGLGDSLLLAVYGEKWRGGLDAATWYAVWAAVLTVEDYLVTAVLARGMPGRGLLIDCLRLACSAAVMAALTPRLGIVAAPVTWTLGAALAAALFGAAVGRVYLARALDVLIRCAACVGVALVVTKAVPMAGSSAVVPCLATVAGGAVYAAAAWFLAGKSARRLFRRELSAIAGAVRRRLAAGGRDEGLASGGTAP